MDTPNPKPDEISALGLDLMFRLRLPESFFDNLEADNDWSFVIKVHALIEMALNVLVTGAIGEKLVDIVARLDTGDKRYGKLAFVKSLELLPKEAIQFVTTLSDLRNKLVHDVRQVAFSFEEWIANMSRANLDNFLKALNFDLDGESLKEIPKMPQIPKKIPDEMVRDDLIKLLHPKLIRLMILSGANRLAIRAIDKESDRITSPLQREADRLQGLVDAYQARKRSSPNES